MEINLVNKIRDLGSNLGSNIKQHGVKYMIIGALLTTPVLAGACAPSQEEINEGNRVYHTEQLRLEAEAEKAAYDSAQMAKIPELETQMGALETKIDETKIALETKIDNQTIILEAKMDEKIKPLQTSIDKLSTDFTAYLENKESEDVYGPSRTGHRHDGSHTGHYSTPYLVESPQDIRDSLRYYADGSATWRMFNWDEDGFVDAFGNVSYLFDGYTGNGEIKSGTATALHVDKGTGERRFYKSNGGTTTSDRNTGKIDDFVVHFLEHNPSYEDNFTIQTVGYHHH